MSSVADFAEMFSKCGDKVDCDKAARAAVSGGPRCDAYVMTPRIFVQEVGSGSGAPIGMDLDSLAKQHAETLILGQDFF